MGSSKELFQELGSLKNEQNKEIYWAYIIQGGHEGLGFLIGLGSNSEVDYFSSVCL